jgi:hypothetical protein
MSKVELLYLDFLFKQAWISSMKGQELSKSMDQALNHIFAQRVRLKLKLDAAWIFSLAV